MRSLFLTKRWQHHTAAGGYDQLAAAFPGAASVRRQPVESVAAKIGRKVWQNRTGGWDHLLDYQFGDLLAESRVLTRSLAGGVDVIHALYGDEQLELLLRQRRLLRSGLVATFHLPGDRVVERWERRQPRLIGGLDAAVVVARSQLEYYRRWLGEDRVVFIPHGISTEHFCPLPERPPHEGLRLLTVGEHMRDWETLHRVADLSAARKLPVTLDAVVPPSCADFFLGCDNVRLHRGIPETQLIRLYQEADALLLPVLSATANNALLESLACGTPVITNATGGMPDYLDDASGWLLPDRDYAAFLGLIEAMCRDRTVAGAKRAGAREKALTFRWEAVVAQTRAVHAAVFQGQIPAAALAAAFG